MTNKTHLTFFEIVKIWWSLFWRSTIYIFIMTIYFLLAIAIGAIILDSLNFNSPIFNHLKQKLSSSIEVLQSLDTEAFNSLYFKVIILGSVLALPLYLKAFNNLHDVLYKRFILKLPARNNFSQRFQTFTPYYIAWSLSSLFLDYGHSLIPDELSYGLIFMTVYLVGTYFITRFWLTRAVAAGRIILEPRE